jgi:hypothetical protein
MPVWLPKFLLIVHTVVFGLALLPTMGMVLMSPMMFDAPGSDREVGLWIAFWAVVALPVAIVAGLVGGWVVFARGGRAIGALLSCLPYVNLAVITFGFSLLRSR